MYSVQAEDCYLMKIHPVRDQSRNGRDVFVMRQLKGGRGAESLVLIEKEYCSDTKYTKYLCLDIFTPILLVRVVAFRMFVGSPRVIGAVFC